MRHLFIALTLWLLAVQSSPAQDAPVPEPAAPAAGSVPEPEPAPADEGVPVDADTELERKIRSRVLQFVETVLEAADEELTEEEKKEIVRELNAEFGDRTRPGAGFTIDINDRGRGGDDSNLELIIPILAVTLIFGTPIIVVIAVLYAGYRKRRLVQETVSQYLASGKDVPAEILENLQGGARPKNYMQKGLVMTGVGLGVIACFSMIGSTTAASLGLIPLFIGLAQLLIWKMEKNDEGVRD